MPSLSSTLDIALSLFCPSYIGGAGVGGADYAAPSAPAIVPTASASMVQGLSSMVAAYAGGFFCLRLVGDTKGQVDGNYQVDAIDIIDT